MNPLLPAAEEALDELRRLHSRSRCDNIVNCPTMAVIQRVTHAIAACKVAELGQVGAIVLRAHVVAMDATYRALK